MTDTLEPQLSDLHMLVLATLAGNDVNYVDELAALLGVSVTSIRPIVADLEAAGLIESHSVH